MNKELNKIVYKYILNSGHEKCATIFLKRSKITKDMIPLSKEELITVADLTQIYENYQSITKPSVVTESINSNNSKRNNAGLKTTAKAVLTTVEKGIVTKKAAAAKESSSSSEEGSDSSSDNSSDEEIAHVHVTKTPVKGTSVAKLTQKSNNVKEAVIANISSSSSESDSSDSDDVEVVAKPIPKTIVPKKNVEVKVIVEKTKPAKSEAKPLMKPISSSDSDDSSDDRSSDDSSEEKTATTKLDSKSKVVAKLPDLKVKAISKSAPQASNTIKASAKPLPTTVDNKAVISKKPSAVQSNSSSDDSSSSDSDDSSSDESVRAKAPITPSHKFTPAKKATAVESSEDDSESDSSSDESVDDSAGVVNDKKRKLNSVVVATAATPASQRSAKGNNAKTKIQKVESSSSESESSSGSSTDSNDSSDDSSDGSESDEVIKERVQMKHDLNKKKMEDSKRASEEWMKVAALHCRIHPYLLCKHPSYSSSS